jgi:hypothetical protein
MIQLLLLADNKKLTAAMKAKKYSPAVGWITSAPKMIAGASKTKGIPLCTDSLKHCILPSNLIKHRINFNFHITTEAQFFQGCTYHIDQ